MKPSLSSRCYVSFLTLCFHIFLCPPLTLPTQISLSWTILFYGPSKGYIQCDKIISNEPLIHPHLAPHVFPQLNSSLVVFSRVSTKHSILKWNHTYFHGVISSSVPSFLVCPHIQQSILINPILNACISWYFNCPAFYIIKHPSLIAVLWDSPLRLHSI